MGSRFYNNVRDLGVGGWVIIAGALLLNFWFDYYHPLGFFIDFAILVALLAGILKTDGEDVKKQVF